MIDSLVSTFVIERDKLTEDEVDQIKNYCESSENTERWEVELNSKHGLISGCCFGLDTGLFYLFLVGIKLDTKIEIIRG